MEEVEVEEAEEGTRGLMEEADTREEERTTSPIFLRVLHTTPCNTHLLTLNTLLLISLQAHTHRTHPTLPNSFHTLLSQWDLPDLWIHGQHTDTCLLALQVADQVAGTGDRVAGGAEADLVQDRNSSTLTRIGRGGRTFHTVSFWLGI
mmetsp:Transcript_38845/g.53962  ORF Transcript_38845/g.53962 Transcript_38845/m.53962 type:complete len:148 (-) Transcript_38845:5-448(-)